MITAHESFRFDLWVLKSLEQSIIIEKIASSPCVKQSVKGFKQKFLYQLHAMELSALNLLDKELGKQVSIFKRNFAFRY